MFLAPEVRNRTQVDHVVGQHAWKKLRCHVWLEGLASNWACVLTVQQVDLGTHANVSVRVGTKSQDRSLLLLQQLLSFGVLATTSNFEGFAIDVPSCWPLDTKTRQKVLAHLKLAILITGNH